MIETTKLVVSSNLLISTSKWLSSFLFALSNTTEHRSLTAPMLLKYPAGSTCGSGAFGRSILGMVGGIEACDILEKPGVVGDLSEDCEDIDLTSAREVLREEMLDPDLSLREKSPILAVSIAKSWVVVGCTGMGMIRRETF